MADKSEEWKPIPLTNNKYQISNFGNVRRLKRVVVVNKTKDVYFEVKRYKQNGYYMVIISVLGRINRLGIHRLVADAFIPNPENKSTVNHINGIKIDNRVENLEWCSQYDNIQHAKQTGLLNKRISRKMVLDIRNRFLKGESVVLIASEYGIKNIQVYDIGTGKFKAHIK